MSTDTPEVKKATALELLSRLKRQHSGLITRAVISKSAKVIEMRYDGLNCEVDVDHPERFIVAIGGMFYWLNIEQMQLLAAFTRVVKR